MVGNPDHGRLHALCRRSGREPRGLRSGSGRAAWRLAGDLGDCGLVPGECGYLTFAWAVPGESLRQGLSMSSPFFGVWTLAWPSPGIPATNLMRCRGRSSGASCILSSPRLLLLKARAIVNGQAKRTCSAFSDRFPDVNERAATHLTGGSLLNDNWRANLVGTIARAVVEVDRGPLRDSLQ